MLSVRNLRKEFDTVVAVDGVSLEVKRGELVGLLGPNGAGKTTTIRAVLNIIRPDSGEITFNGHPFTKEIWNEIGYLPEERGLYHKSKIISTILYFASLKGKSKKQARQSAFIWLERFGLKGEEHRRIGELSKGNQQKIQLIISILHRPSLLILDEPFSSLDPINQILLKDVLLELRQKNTAIVFSTHHMEQVEKMCDNICLINKGKPVLSGDLYAIKKRYGTNSVHIEYDGDGEFLKDYDFIRRAEVYQNYAELELTDITKSAELLANLHGKLSLRKFEIVEPSLNSIFIHVVEEQDQIIRAGEKPIPPVLSQLKSHSIQILQDGRIRKALFLLIGTALITLCFMVYLFFQATYRLEAVGVLAVATVYSALRFMQVRKKVKQELSMKTLPEKNL